MGRPTFKKTDRIIHSDFAVGRAFKHVVDIHGSIFLEKREMLLQYPISETKRQNWSRGDISIIIIFRYKFFVFVFINNACLFIL